MCAQVAPPASSAWPLSAVPQIFERLRPRLELVERPILDRNEREAEYGFVVPRIKGSKILDVGYVEGSILERFETAIGVDQRLWNRFPGREYQADVVAGLPFPDRFFDTVICLSTLEHVGLGHYGDAPYDGDALQKAFRELVRVTAGRLIVTVPLYCPIQDFHRDISITHLLDWGYVIPLAELTIFTWQEPVGRSAVRFVGAALYQAIPRQSNDNPTRP